MEKIQFDSGVRSYRINGGQVLRFNPGDPNLYARFLDSLEELTALEAELTKAIDEYNTRTYGWTQEELEAARCPMQIMFE